MPGQIFMTQELTGCTLNLQATRPRGCDIKGASSLEVHHLVGDTLADVAAHHAGQAVLQELDAQAADPGAHPVAQPGLVGLERCARHPVQHPPQRCRR